jgi:hypothetical protein
MYRTTGKAAVPYTLIFVFFDRRREANNGTYSECGGRYNCSEMQQQLIN